MRTLVSCERLVELLLYDAVTGAFTRRIRQGPWLAGTDAGYLTEKGYLRIAIDGCRYMAQRLAWFYVTGEWPEHEVDHEDRVKTNNRWLNLRAATHKQNSENHPLRSDNKSGHAGVRFVDGAWIVETRHNGKLFYLRGIPTLLDAVAARRSMQRRFFTHASVA